MALTLGVTFNAFVLCGPQQDAQERVVSDPNLTSRLASRESAPGRGVVSGALFAQFHRVSAHCEAIRYLVLGPPRSFANPLSFRRWRKRHVVLALLLPCLEAHQRPPPHHPRRVGNRCGLICRCRGSAGDPDLVDPLTEAVLGAFERRGFTIVV